jgi:hypothetical protein
MRSLVGVRAGLGEYTEQVQRLGCIEAPAKRSKESRLRMSSPSSQELSDFREQVLFALVDDQSKVRQRLREMLERMTPNPLSAFGEVFEHVERVLANADQIRQANPTALDVVLSMALRVQSDLVCGFEALIDGDSAAVLDNCRDLMEVTALVRAFHLDEVKFLEEQDWHDEHGDGPFLVRKTMYDKWVDLQGAPGKGFSYSDLNKKFPNEPYVPGETAEEIQLEYQRHSRSLHPSMWSRDFTSLARVRMPLNEIAEEGEYFLMNHSTELLKHMYYALQHLYWWIFVQLHGLEIHEQEFLTHGHWPVRLPSTHHWIYVIYDEWYDHEHDEKETEEWKFSHLEEAAKMRAKRRAQLVEEESQQDSSKK